MVSLLQNVAISGVLFIFLDYSLNSTLMLILARLIEVYCIKGFFFRRLSRH